MPNLFKVNKYTFSTKVILSFFIFIFFFILIRFSLVIPKVEKDAYTNEVKQITKIVSLLKEQIIMAGKSILMQREIEIELYKKIIETNILRIKLNYQNSTKSELDEILKSSKISKICSYTLGKKNQINILDTWQDYEQVKARRLSKSSTYNTLMSNDLVLSLACSSRKFNPGHRDFEESLRTHISKNLSLSQNTLYSKATITWINYELLNDDSGPLYEKNKELKKKKYRISKLSNTKELTTGELSAKEIFAANGKEPIEHVLNDEKVITWVSLIKESTKHDLYTLIYTIKKEDLLNKSRANLFVLLPETLIAILIALIIILLIFKRLFRNINTLSQTAIKINQGKKNIRSNVKGEDDIGILGQAFDSMLDLFENNIKTLDLKVEEKTKEISRSLEEKNTLLKEIHHRVKNNLSLTISLIELQEDDITDKRTKKVLIDIQERIYTMELLHRKLYESTDLNKILFNEYIEDLIKSISISYDMNNSVEINVNVENIELDIETAMPCGLIINELVTNSFKYAFLNNSNPKLEVNIFIEDQQLMIIVKDNGKGLKEEFSENINTLGLKLINTIVQYQLFGKIDYIYEDGAKFKISTNISH